MEVVSGLLTILVGTSRETSDFIADAIERWWTTNQERWVSIRTLTIDLDNGPENASCRTQFIKRMVAFADRHQREIELVYYPPYHSKYNPIERVWGVLENHWKGQLLDSVEKVIGLAKTMKYNGKNPVVKYILGTYEKGVKLTTKAMEQLEKMIDRVTGIEKWAVDIPWY